MNIPYGICVLSTWCCGASGSGGSGGGGGGGGGGGRDRGVIPNLFLLLACYWFMMF